MSDVYVDNVRKKLKARSQVAINKHGVTPDKAGLTTYEWLSHLQEELMDACVYLEAALHKERGDSLPKKTDVSIGALYDLMRLETEEFTLHLSEDKFGSIVAVLKEDEKFASTTMDKHTVHSEWPYALKSMKEALRNA